MNMNRRDFIRLSSMAGAGALVGCQTAPVLGKVEPKFAWSALIHLGMNEWHDDVGYEQKWPNLTDPIEAKAIAEEYVCADHVRFDEAVWGRVSRKLWDSGMNQLVIDLGEAVVYPSHPEIAAKGAWSPDKLRAELRRLRGMGIEPIPKLNFSTTHDLWMGVYHRMVSTPQYYAVVRDLIRDVCEIFDWPRYFHLGLDEENSSFQSYGQKITIVREKPLWWEDLHFYVSEVERHGARAWVWSGCARAFPREVFVKNMPKSVVQSPWWYTGDLNDQKYTPTRALVELAQLDYDVVPCSSNCYSYKDAMSAVVKFCDERFDPKHVLGYQMAPWLEMNTVLERRWNAAADDLAAAIRQHKA